MNSLGINIVDVLSKPTAPKTFKPQAERTVPKPIVNEDFDDIVQTATEIIAPTPAQETPIETNEEPEFDSEQSAEALIDLIDIAQKSLFIYLGARKLKKKIPEELLEQFIQLDIKEMSGEDLTDKEKKQLQRYKDFERRIERLATDVPFTEQERNDLRRCSEAFVTKAGINIPPSLWFGAQVFSIISKRGIDVMMS